MTNADRITALNSALMEAEQEILELRRVIRGMEDFIPALHLIKFRDSVRRLRTSTNESVIMECQEILESIGKLSVLLDAGFSLLANQDIPGHPHWHAQIESLMNQIREFEKKNPIAAPLPRRRPTV